MPNYDKLKERLRMAGITRSMVAALTESSSHTVDNWLSRGNPIPPHKLKLIEHAINGGPVAHDAVMSFAVRVTHEEWRMLCEHAGVESMDALQAEAEVRALLQDKWRELAAKNARKAAQPAE